MNIFKRYEKQEISVFQAIKLLDSKNETNDKKNDGVIYTPSYISDYIISLVDYKLTETILEPSVGHGVFLFSLLNYVEDKYKLKGTELKNWFESKVFATDINEQNIIDTKKLLSIYFKNKGLDNISLKNITCNDSLFCDYEKIDTVIGNPPYIRTKNLKEAYLKKIRENFISCKKGNVDIFYAFIEKMNLIANKVAFIVPNSYLSNSSSKSLREIIKDDLNLVIDFKNELIFEDARTYTSIFVLNKKEKVDEILYKESLGDEFITFNKSDLNDSQWIFKKLSNDKTKSVVDLYPVYGGIATLKDKIYLIESPNIIEKENKKYFKQIFNKKEYLIEEDICLSFIKLTKLKKDYKIIYPYIGSKIMKEDYLKNNYPKTYEYLNDVRIYLDQRDKGKVDKYESWFAYGRKQGLTEKKEKYFLLLPIMATEKYECAIISSHQNFMSTSGFVVGFNSMNELNEVKKIFESKEFFEYLKIKGKPWAGKTPYYSFSKTHLKDFKIK